MNEELSLLAVISNDLVLDIEDIDDMSFAVFSVSLHSLIFQQLLSCL
jgi:hypothetical protein